MATTGLQLGASSSVDTLTSTTWTNITNIRANDDTETTEAIVAKNTPGTGSTTSGWIKVGNFGFDSLIPAGSTIDNVEIQIRWRVSSTGGIANRDCSWAVSGTRGTNTHTLTTEPVTLETTTLTVTSERSWTRADLLNGTFEVHARGMNGNSTTDPSYRFAWIKVNVTYTLPAVNTAYRASFPTPTAALAIGAGLQQFRARAYVDGAGAPTGALYLWENGSVVGSAIWSGTVTGTSGSPQTVEGTWDATGRTAANIEARFVGTGVGGGTARLHSIEWIAQVQSPLVAGTTREVRYDISGRATQTGQIRYDVSSRAGTTRALLYDISAQALLAGTTRALLYDVSSRATQTRELRYDVLSRATQTAAVLYNISSRAGTTRDLLYDIAQQAGVAGKTVAVLYNVSGRATKTGQLRYDVSSRATQTRVLSYNISTRAGTTGVVSYNISSRAGTTRQVLYDLLANTLLAGTTRVVRFDVSAAPLLAGTTREILFNVFVNPPPVQGESIAPTLTEEQIERGILTGAFGQIEYDFHIYRSNILGENLEELGTVENASFSLDNHRDHTWELNLPMQAVMYFDILSEWAKLEVHARAAGYEVIRPFGHYFFDERSGADTPMFERWELKGKSAEARLMGSTAHAVYAAPAGTGVLAAVKAILLAQNVPSSMILFPGTDQDVPLATAIYFDPFQNAQDTRWLKICNQILAAGGFIALFTDNEGRMTTRKINPANQLEADITYGTTAESDNMIVSEEIPYSYDDENFANRVVVYSGDPSEAASFGVAENHDPNSRVSYERLGQRWVQRDAIELPSLVSPAEAQQVALQALRLASGMNLIRTFETNFDTRIKP